MTRVDWYFDFISPYAYLSLKRLADLPPDLEITPRPVLFAALLNHWEHKGPAEIPAKRRQTFRQVLWKAKQRGLAITAPPRHPFNPLALLRLCLSLGCEWSTIHTIFDHVWRDGEDGQAPDSLARLAGVLGVEDLEARIADQAVKDALRANCDEAIARGVYGVPTFAVRDELFWGDDATEMMLDYVADPGLFSSGDYRRFAEMEDGVSRR